MRSLHDKVLQQVCPTVMVPRFGEHESLNANGHRFLAASDGLWLETRREWLHIVWPLAQQASVAMPYGSLEPSLKFAFDYLPGDLFRRFINDARKALPNEFAAWLTWDSHTVEFTYRPLTTISAGPVHLELERPVLGECEHLVIDIHSHAHERAFFSSEDNRDDRGEVKLSVVIGTLGEDHEITSRFRLCVNGLTIPAKEVKQAMGGLWEEDFYT